METYECCYQHTVNFRYTEESEEGEEDILTIFNYKGGTPILKMNIIN